MQALLKLKRLVIETALPQIVLYSASRVMIGIMELPHSK